MQKVYHIKSLKFKVQKSKLIFKILVWIFPTASFIWMSKALLLGYYPDFVTQYAVPKIVFSGGNPYEGGEGLYTPQVYPPTTFLFFWPFTLFSLSFASYFYTFFSIVALLISLFLLFRLYDEKLNNWRSLLLMGLVFVYFPVKFTLGMGQINHFILLLIVISLWYLKKRQEFRAGIFLGLSIVIKLFPLFLPLYFFIKIKKIPLKIKDKFHWSGFFKLRVFNVKFWVWPSQVSENIRLLWGIATALLVSIILVSILIPSHLNIHFVVEVFPNLANSWKLDYYNQALSGFVGRSFGTETVGTIIKLIVSGIITIVALFAVSKNERMDFLTVALKFGTLIVVSLLVNTFSWQHHYVWLIIPYFSTYYFILKNRLSNTYVFILIISYLLTAANIKNPQILPAILQSHVFYGGLILFFLNIYLLLMPQNKKS